MKKIKHMISYLNNLITQFKAKKAENHKILIKGTVLDNTATTKGK